MQCLFLFLQAHISRRHCNGYHGIILQLFGFFSCSTLILLSRWGHAGVLQKALRHPFISASHLPHTSTPTGTYRKFGFYHIFPCLCLVSFHWEIFLGSFLSLLAPRRLLLGRQQHAYFEGDSIYFTRLITRHHPQKDYSRRLRWEISIFLGKQFAFPSAHTGILIICSSYICHRCFNF